jgi:hypothetical protein
MPLPRNDLTAEFVRSLFDIDEKNAQLVWKPNIACGRTSRGGNSRPGQVAGYVFTNGYRYIQINKRHYLAHRIIYLYKNGEWPPGKIDHATGDRLDNSKIRPADDYQNSMNKGKSRRNTSGFKGVSMIRGSGRWRAQIVARDRHYSLGVYATKEEAHAAYCKAASELHGEFANFG